MSGKRLAFVLSVLIFWTSAAQAETIDFAEANGGNEIMSAVGRIKPLMIQKIFSLDAALSDDKTLQSVPVEPEKSQEDVILERWKQKQIDRWSSLPEGKFEINASAYTAAADECGKSDGVTASGLKVARNRTLACPPQYPFGAKIAIEGFGTFRCEDRGGAIKGNRFDVYMETKKEAFAFGRRHLVAEVVSD